MREPLIEKIRRLPEQIEALVAGLSADELTTAYLPGEWTVAQNVHHLVDSHLNSYIRCKLMATEEHPPLKPYDQDVWAQFADASTADLTHSLAMLHGLHARWIIFWQNLTDDQWRRTGNHLASGSVTLEEQLALYAAHGEAHIDQIQRTLAAR